MLGSWSWPWTVFSNVSVFLASQVHGCRQRHLILWGPAPRWASRGFNLQQQMKCIPIRCLGSKMSSFWEEQNNHLDICWSKFYRMLKHVQCKLLTRRIGDQVYSHEVAAYILRAILWTARQLVDVQQSKPFRCGQSPIPKPCFDASATKFRRFRNQNQTRFRNQKKALPQPKKNRFRNQK